MDCAPAMQSPLEQFFVVDRHDAWLTVAHLAGAAAIGLAVQFVAARAARRWARRSDTPMDVSAIERLVPPTRVFLPLLALQFAAPTAGLPGGVLQPLRHVMAVALILSLAWTLIAFVGAIERSVVARHDMAARDNLRARRIHTQFAVLSRVATAVVAVVALAGILMTFPSIRQVGASLMASAGILGIVVGLAARPTLANWIAGLQIALAEPIRLDDVVIVAGEWGRVEEITGTYVVVRVWDDRRVVTPLTWFLENPFQNWTRSTADLLGTAFLYLDPGVPLDGLRAELQRLCKGAPQWDGRVCLLQVTDQTERAMQVRALVSAKDSGALFDLRCAVREGLLAWVREHHPDALPRLRASTQADEGPAAASIER